MYNERFWYFCSIEGLQSIPGDSNDKDVAAMLDELTIEAAEESFVVVLQNGGNDVTCKTSSLQVRTSSKIDETVGLSYSRVGTLSKKIQGILLEEIKRGIEIEASRKRTFPWAPIRRQNTDDDPVKIKTTARYL